MLLCEPPDETFRVSLRLRWSQAARQARERKRHIWIKQRDRNVTPEDLPAGLMDSVLARRREGRVKRRYGVSP